MVLSGSRGVLSDPRMQPAGPWGVGHRWRRAVLAVVSVVLPSTLPAQTPGQWAAAARAISRLSPAAFPELPPQVRQALDRQGCTVPQSFAEDRPHNVIRGRFARAGQLDWAVLCSRRDSSAVLIFWGGRASELQELGRRTADAGFLQHVGGGQIGYSHVIRTVGPAELRERAGPDGAALPVEPEHDGLEDAFAEKFSAISYLEEGRWLLVGGAD
jgi:hypothetical protein